MSSLLAFGLFLQLLAVFLVLKQTGRRWLSYTGVLFVIFAFVFHGLAEIIQFIFPGHNFYRQLVSQSDIDAWVLIVSLAIFTFSLVYSFILKTKSKVLVNEPQQFPSTELVDWRLVALATIPGYIIAISASSTAAGYWISGLIEQFLIFGIVLSFLLYLLKHEKMLIPVMFAQTILLTLMGSRLSVAAALIMLLSAAIRYGISVRFKHIFAMLLLIAAISISISSARVDFGRDVFTESVSERSIALASSFTSANPSQNGASKVIDDFIYRIDGNAFGGMIYARLKSGINQPAGLRPLFNNLLLSVPTFLNSNKLATEVHMLEEESYMILHYALPMGIDFLPTTLGIIFGYYGTPLLLIVAVVLGFIFASADIWLQRSTTLSSLLIGIALTYCIAFMEQGLRVYFLTFRGALILFIFLALAQNFQRVFRRKRKSRPFSGQPKLHR